MDTPAACFPAVHPRGVPRSLPAATVRPVVLRNFGGAPKPAEWRHWSAAQQAEWRRHLGYRVGLGLGLGVGLGLGLGSGLGLTLTPTLTLALALALALPRTIWFFLLAWLAWSFLSLRDELPWDGIIGTLLLGIVVEPGSKIGKAIAIGLVVYLVLEVNVKSRALYQRRKARNSPGAESTSASLVTVEDADADENDDANGDGDDEAGASPRKQSQYMPPLAATGLEALAGPLVAISPAKTYEAMQIGAALRRLDKRKHQETAAIAKKLVPKLNAEQKRYEEEISQLDLCRATCTDNATIITIDAQKTKMEQTHCTALGLLEADVRSPIPRHLDNSQASFPTVHTLLIYCSFVATPTFTGDAGTGEVGAGSHAGNCKLSDQLDDL